MSALPGPFRLDGMSAAVTGAASGIGLACARMLAGAGASVLLLDQDAGALAAATASLPGARSALLDVADAGAAEAVLGGTAAPDILVNSAGIARRHPATDHPVADWDAVMGVNVSGGFFCARAVAKGLMESGRPGAIINIASIMGLSGGGIYPNISYQTSKGAVVNMTRALAIEWAPSRIRVNAIAPTYVRTPFIRPLLEDPAIHARLIAMTPLGRLAEPEEVAAAALYLASPAAAMVTGHVLAVDGGFLAQ